MRPASLPLIPRQRHKLPVEAGVASGSPRPGEPFGAPPRGRGGCGWCGTPVREVPWYPESPLHGVGRLVRLRCLLGHWSLTRS